MEVNPPGAVKIRSPDGKVYEVPLRRFDQDLSLHKSLIRIIFYRSDGIYFIRLNDVWEFYAKATGNLRYFYFQKLFNFKYRIGV